MSDLRQNMHPAVAGSMELTPENMAIIEGTYLPQLPFGHMVTKLSDEGIIRGDSLPEIAVQTEILLGVGAQEFDTRLQDSTSLDDLDRSLYAANAHKAYRKLFNAGAQAIGRSEIRTAVHDNGVQRSPQVQQEFVEQQRQVVAEFDGMTPGITRKILGQGAEAYLAELEEAGGAVRAKDVLTVAASVGARLVDQGFEEADADFGEEVKDILAKQLQISPYGIDFEDGLDPDLADTWLPGTVLDSAMPRAYATTLVSQPQVRDAIDMVANRVERILFGGGYSAREQFLEVYPTQDRALPT